jgi:6-phosphogluconate dehydrogenase
MPRLISFQAIAARVQREEPLPADLPKSYPCVRHIGPGGAGQYVKMVHNGIEYGDMQLIAEACHVCRDLACFDAADVAALFEELNKGQLGSFLMEVTSLVHRVEDAHCSGSQLVHQASCLEHLPTLGRIHLLSPAPVSISMFFPLPFRLT